MLEQKIHQKIQGTLVLLLLSWPVASTGSTTQADDDTPPLPHLPHSIWRNNQSISAHSDLHYNLQDINYPSQGLTLQELNLCDMGWSGLERRPEWLHDGALECPPRQKGGSPGIGKLDPTCLSCIDSESLEAGANVRTAYKDSRGQLQRRELLSSWLDYDDQGEPLSPYQDCTANDPVCQNKVVVVVAADDKYLNFLQYWVCNALSKGLSPRSLLVYSYGPGVTSWAQGGGLFVLEAASTYDLGPAKRIRHTYKYTLFPLFLDLLSMGKHVLFSDVDVIWTDNMAAKLPYVWQGVDLVSSLAERENYVGLNSGVVLLRPTPEMQVFMETLLEVIPMFLVQDFGGGGDQIIWNHLLRHYALRSLSWKPIPGPIILRNNFKVRNSKYTLGVHFLGNSKKMKLYHMARLSLTIYSNMVDTKCFTWLGGNWATMYKNMP